MRKGERVDLYGFIHKAQRDHLYTLGSKIGRADLMDPVEMEQIEQELRKMIAHLKGHSHSEDSFIHPLYREIGDMATPIDEEHHELEEALGKLEEILNQKNWQKLYSEFNRFLAYYLSHQDEEERMQETVLWKHFDDARLARVLVAFNEQRSPEVKANDLVFLIPALSIPELIRMFCHLKASATPAAFQAACQIAKTHLEQDRWSKICSQII